MTIRNGAAMVKFAKESGDSVAASPEYSGKLFLSKVPKMEFDNLCFDGGQHKPG
jgi:hypothetical protein